MSKKKLIIILYDICPTLISLLTVIYIYELLGISELELLPFLFGGFWLLYKTILKKREKVNKNEAFWFFLLAVYISFSFFIGKMAWREEAVHFLSTRNFLIVLCGIPGIWIALTELSILYDHKIYSKEIKFYDRFALKHCFLLFTIGLILCWSVSLVANYPGIIISDYTWQFEQAKNGGLNNHHPIIHTLLIRLAQNISTLLWGYEDAAHAVFINSLMQMVLLAVILGFVSSYFWNNCTRKYVGVLMWLYYAFFPMNGIFSVYMTKDVIFSALVFLFSFMVYRMEGKEKDTSKHLGLWRIVFALVVVGVILFRNNGFLIVLGTLAVILLYDRKSKVMWCTFLISVMVFLIYGQILKLCNIEGAELAESLGMPINQIANVVSNHEVDDDSKHWIEQVMPIERIKELYNKRYSDPIKFSPDFNSLPLEENKGKYLKLWVKLFLQYPRDCLEASLNLTIGFWYPGVEKGCISYNYNQRDQLYKDIGIDEYSKCDLFRHFIEPDVRLNPWEAWLWSPGLAVMIMLVLFVTSIIKMRNITTAFLPGIIGWSSILLATPSYCETRYIYFIFLLIPFWIGTIIKENGDKGVKKYG